MLATEFAGIVTASEFHGDASNLTNLPASGDSNDITGFIVYLINKGKNSKMALKKTQLLDITSVTGINK